MLLIYEHAEGVFDFKAEQQTLLSFHPIYIPGATVYHADQSSGHFIYQKFQHSLYTLYSSTYMPVKDCSLRVETAEPFVGFRIMLHKHLLHQINDQLYFMLQGQANFVVAPGVSSALHLRNGVIYQVFDMELSPLLMKRLQVTNPIFEKLLAMQQIGKTIAVGGGPTFVGALVLDMTIELLNDPGNDHLAMTLLNHVLTATVTPLTERTVTEQQIDTLSAVRDSIRANVARNHRLSDWARISGMNITYFKELFKYIFGISPYHYLLYERIKKAKSLLLYQPHLSKTEVASQCGFSDRNNLRRAFFVTERISLSQWLRNHRIR